MGKLLRILTVDDSQEDAELLVRDLSQSGYEIVHERVQTPEAMKAALVSKTWDAVISDYSLSQFSGVDALNLLKQTGLDVPFIIVSGMMGEETAVAALKAGAHDFLVKGRLARLGPALERELCEVVERRERAQAQEALRQAEARFRSLFEHAVFGIYQATLDGRFLAVNPALVTMLGYESGDQLLPVGLPNVYEQPADGLELLQHAQQERPFTDRQAIWRRKTGESIRVRLSGRVIEAPGCTPVLEVIVEDATERHRLEQQLRQAQKMEGIGRLAGGIAHDFNNMLTTITGYSQMILEQIGPDKPISGDLIEIRDAANRAADLTRQLLAFSRQQVLRIGNVDVSEVVRNMRPMLQRLIRENITIELDLGRALPPVLADRVQLEQVLLNLAGNAGDAMPTGGRLVIVTAVASAAEAVALTGLPVAPGRYVKLTMQDTGTGMDERTRQRIFEPFFTTKDLGKGTGLGLATVYGIVKQLGGYIWVTSQLGEGTTFTLFFPEGEAKPDPVVAPPTPSIVAPLSREREVVLVVEDEMALRKLVGRTLTRHGYRVLEAGTAPEGLVLAAQSKDRIHLVVSDVVMPQMSGPEMVSQLRETVPDLKVLYVSGYAGEALTRAGTPELNAPLLGKPFTAHDLLQRVRALLEPA
jgi:hypothetical protein